MDRILEIIDNWLMRRFFVISKAEKIGAQNLDSEIYKAARWAYSGLLSTSDFDHNGMRFAESYSRILYAEALPSQKIKGLSLDRKKKIQESFNRYMIQQKHDNLREAAEFYRKLILIIIGLVILVTACILIKNHDTNSLRA
jgi:hypothetical protein